MSSPKAIIRLKLVANQAKPSPVLGQSLGQYGINIMDFCKKFNSATKNLKDGIIVPINVIFIVKHLLQLLQNTNYFFFN